MLLSRDGVAKVADVGLARLLTREGAQVSVQGTFEWAAPEVGAPAFVFSLHAAPIDHQKTFPLRPDRSGCCKELTQGHSHFAGCKNVDRLEEECPHRWISYQSRGGPALFLKKKSEAAVCTTCFELKYHSSRQDS